jgi:hypothetical protein
MTELMGKKPDPDTERQAVIAEQIAKRCLDFDLATPSIIDENPHLTFVIDREQIELLYEVEPIDLTAHEKSD